MEALIKKYFWTTNLVFLAIGAWLLSNAINSVITLKLRPIPSLNEKSLKGPADNEKEILDEDNQVVIDRNYFGSILALKTAGAGSGPDIDEDSAKNLLLKDGQQSSLRATLVGTIVASDARWSMAVITDQGLSQTNIYRVGDRLMDEATVAAIHTQKIYVIRNGAKEYIEIQEKGAAKTSKPSPARPPPVAAATRPESGGDGEINVRSLGADRYAIDRGEIDKTLSNLNSIAMQARIVPSFVNGEADGFKLFAIRPGSLYQKMGIENGDVIQKINGFPMNSPDKALEVYQKLKTANSVEIEVNRNGQKKKLTYQIN